MNIPTGLLSATLALFMGAAHAQAASTGAGQALSALRSLAAGYDSRLHRVAVVGDVSGSALPHAIDESIREAVL